MNPPSAARDVAAPEWGCYATGAVRAASPQGRSMDAGPSTVLRRSRVSDPGALVTTRHNRQVWYLQAELEQAGLSSIRVDIGNTVEPLAY
jgi:hypothetical protein